MPKSRFDDSVASAPPPEPVAPLSAPPQAPLIGVPYRLLAARSYSALRPVHSAVALPPDVFTTVDVPRAAIDAFNLKLHEQPIGVESLSDLDIRAEIAGKVVTMLNVQPADPIKGVYVIRSRPSCDGVVWRTDMTVYWVHPTVSVNGASTTQFAVAPNTPWVGWVSAAVGAFRE
jgi:hypothetical protein